MLPKLKLSKIEEILETISLAASKSKIPYKFTFRTTRSTESEISSNLIGEENGNLECVDIEDYNGESEERISKNALKFVGDLVQTCSKCYALLFIL